MECSEDGDEVVEEETVTVLGSQSNTAPVPGSLGDGVDDTDVG